VFGLACRVLPDPETGAPMVVPRRPPRGAASTAGEVPGGSADGALRADG
jgi:iron complex transport system ATP-binding protein